MKPTHKTVYTMDIKWHNVCCWLIGSCRDEPLMQCWQSSKVLFQTPLT